MPREFLIIANPISGGGRSKRQAPKLRDALIARGQGAELYFTERGGDAGRRAAEIRPGQYDGVISVGGDGTLNEVINGLVDPSIPLCVLAMGTANVLAYELKLPRNPEALADMLTAGHTHPAAIGLIEGRRFLLFASTGLDANIVQRVEAVRTGTLGKWRWVVPALHTVRRWSMKPRRITTEEGTTHDGITTVVISRVSTYGGIFALPGDIDIGDGKLHVLAFRQRSRWQYFFAALRALRGRLRLGRDVIHLTTRSLKVENPTDYPWQADGDIGGQGDFQVSLDPANARLFVPPPSS